MRYLWISSLAIILAGAALTAAGLAGLLDTIAMVCGFLLLWTGIVKIVVLRIWQRSIASQPKTVLTAKAEAMDPVARSTL